MTEITTKAALLAAAVDQRLEEAEQAPVRMDGMVPTHHLVALNQPQLQAAHAQMLGYIRQMIAETRSESVGERANLATAREQGWATAPFERRVRTLGRSLLFYEKLEAALEAGFVLVPNFQMDVFAIRTDAINPRGTVQPGRWNRFVQNAQLLPPGEGRYVGPLPAVEEDVSEVFQGETRKEVVRQWPSEFLEVAFPLALARPEIVTRAGEVMAMKLFDEIGLARNADQGGARGDPILLGHLRNPRRMRQGATFFLGWYFDPRVL